MTGIRAKTDSRREMTWLEMKKQKAIIATTGHTPCRKKREPVKIRTKPFTGARMHSEIRKVSPTDVTPANSRSTIQSGRPKVFVRRPSMVYGSAISIATPHRMFEFTVNMQKVRSPIWSKLTS